MKKVYVLICDSATSGVNATDVKTFSTKAKAQAEMKKCFEAELNDWKSWCSEHLLLVDVRKTSMTIWESCNYDENHVDWTIYEQEVL